MQVIERLTERRIAVEKAVTTLGEAPSGLRDVFELCRGFERAFTNIVNVRSGQLCCSFGGVCESAEPGFYAAVTAYVRLALCIDASIISM